MPKLAMPPITAKPSHAKKLPLTHFLSVPIGHHSALRENWTRISTALLESSPPILGLHESIILKPGSLHLTLGVLSLASQKQRSIKINDVAPREEKAAMLEDMHSALDSDRATSSANPASVYPAPPQHTVQDALLLLYTLKGPIQDILKTHAGERYEKLRVPLERMDIMRSRPNQKLEQSHVMWAGPDVEGEVGRRLKSVCDLVHSTFKHAGMLQDDRPLKLHCTLINTVYRKEKGTDRRRNKKRVPFSFADILSSAAYAQIGIPAETTEVEHGPRKVDLGSWTVDEVQLCEMGSKDADGVYRSVGTISLYDNM